MKIIGRNSDTKQFARDDLNILDKNVVNFELKKISNCSLIDAYKILYYHRKFNTGFFSLYCDGIFKSSPKYLQTIKVEGRWTNCVLMEHVIAQYLIQRKYILKNEDWLYVGWHEFSAYRIVVGHGPGIILSRFLNEDVQQEIKSTLLYLRRIKILDLKIFSTINNVEGATPLNLSDILRYAEDDYALYSISKKNSAFIEDKIGTFQLAVLIVLSCCFVYNLYELRQQESRTAQSQIIENENLQVKVNPYNAIAIKSFLESMNDNLDWKKVRDFCCENRIQIQKLSIEKDIIKIKTTLPIKVLEHLKQKHKIEYRVTSEYKEFGLNSSADAVIWFTPSQSPR